MVQSWRPDPQLKVEADSTEISADSISVQVVRPENAVSRVRLSANDYKGKNFIANLDALDILKVSFRYGSDAWTKVFEGRLEDVNPVISGAGQIVNALAYGYGRALRNTFCNENYGAESDNSTLDTPEEIWDDIVDNRVNKNFDAGNTGYAITKTYIAALANPTINFIRSPYRPNIELINEVCMIYNAYRTHANAGVHWFVDPSKNLYINTIGAHEDSVTWPDFWNGSEAASTLVEGKDILTYSFNKLATGFANKVILATQLRKPGYDYWTEDSGGSSLWGDDNLKGLSDSTTQFVVGSHSLKIEVTGGTLAHAYYPSTEDAGWDIEKIESEKSVPTLNFYFWKSPGLVEASSFAVMFTTDHDTDIFRVPFTISSDPDNEWVHRSLPIGNYWKTTDESRRFRWVANGAPDWADINGVTFSFLAGVADFTCYVDDLHISGNLIREAYNSTSIAANDEHQKVVVMNTSVDDTMKASTDTGLAARLAYAELLAAQTMPTVGIVTMPLIVDILPGQKVAIDADKQSSGAYRIDENFRVTNIIHLFSLPKPTTTLYLTNDLKNTFAKNPSDLRSVLSKVVFTDPEAKNLKVSGIDPRIPRLSKDYPS